MASLVVCGTAALPTVCAQLPGYVESRSSAGRRQSGNDGHCATASRTKSRKQRLKRQLAHLAANNVA